MEVNGGTCDASAPSQETNASSNIASSELDEETTNKLRGDAIGNTMYSEVFVLNTLMQFSDLHWNAEVEENLCFLWDMTEEKDVCRYLFQLSYPSLACSAITDYNEPRFIEIVVGIFGNLLCSKCEKTIKEDEIKTVLNLLNSNNPYILIQVMRFIHAVAFMFDKLPFISEGDLDRFNFILYSSTNKELLSSTLKTIASITDDRKLGEGVLKGELLQSATTAFKHVKVDNDSESQVETFESQDQHAVVKHLIQFVCNICCYVDHLNLTRLAHDLNLYVDEFSKEMGNLLNYFTTERTLWPLPEEFTFYVEALTYIYRILSVGYTPIIVAPMCKILLILSDKNHDCLQSYSELLCYFISKGNPDCLKRDVQKLPQIKKVLLDIEKGAFSFGFEYLGNLRESLSVL